MFKFARLVPYPDWSGFSIIDRRTGETVGEARRRPQGGYDIHIHGKHIGTAHIGWEASYLADRYLRSVGSPRKKRKK